MIANGDDFDEIWVTSLAVSGLLKLYKKNPSQQFDLRFMKAVLIALHGINKIKAEEPIEAGKLTLANDFFEWRVKKEELRMRSYEHLFSAAMNGIRNNDFT